MLALERLLVQPSAEEFQQTVTAALAAANGSKRAGVLQPGPEPMRQLVHDVTSSPEGQLLWNADPGPKPKLPMSRLQVVWGTDGAGQKHVRLRSDRPTKKEQLPIPFVDLPPLGQIYPERMAWRTVGGERSLCFACSCGRVGALDELHWTPEDCCACRPPQRNLRLALPGASGWTIRHQFSPDSATLITTGYQDVRGILVWDLAQRQQRGHIELDLPYAKAFFNQTGDKLAFHCTDHSVRVWDVSSVQQLLMLPEVGENVDLLAFTGDDRFLVISHLETLVEVWDLQQRQRRWQFTTAERSIDPENLTVARNGRWVALQALNLGTQVWNLHTGEAWLNIPSDAFPVGKTPVFLEEEQLLLPNPAGKGIDIWDLASKERRSSIASEGTVSTLTLAPEGNLLAGWCYGKSNGFCVWDVTTHQLRAKLVRDWRTHGQGGGSNELLLRFSPDERYFAGLDRNATITIWDLKSGRELGTLEWPGRFLQAVTFAPDSRSLLLVSVAGKEGYLTQWNWEGSR